MDYQVAAWENSSTIKVGWHVRLKHESLAYFLGQGLAVGGDTAARIRVLKAFSLHLAPSWISMARRMLLEGLRQLVSFATSGSGLLRLRFAAAWCSVATNSFRRSSRRFRLESLVRLLPQ